VQFGGGLRSLNDIERALALGVTRVVLGTIAVTDPELLREAIRQFGPDQIAVGLDARDGRIRIRGWQTDSGLDVIELGRQVHAAGVQTVIHTDIGRDGDLTGVNGPASSQLAQATGLHVIASGGVSGPADLHHLRTLPGITGVIIGRALYEGKINPEELLRET
jgi:phosphoribosylformimino-5-aminoimidazole carboxamide ribotide isomerase